MQDIKQVHTTQMTSPRSGAPVDNQFSIITPEGKYFQSYDSVIVFIANSGQVYLDKETWNYSRTTSKYRNRFLNSTTKDIKDAIKSGKYILKDLNK